MQLKLFFADIRDFYYELEKEQLKLDQTKFKAQMLLQEKKLRKILK